MTEYHRVKDPVSGAEYTYDTEKIEALGLQKAVIDKDPFGPDGRPASVKYRMPLGEPAQGTAQARRRGRKATTQTSGAQGSGDNAGQQSAEPEKEI